MKINWMHIRRWQDAQPEIREDSLGLVRDGKSCKGVIKGVAEVLGWSEKDLGAPDGSEEGSGRIQPTRKFCLRGRRVEQGFPSVLK